MKRPDLIPDPPKWPERILKRILKPHYVEELLGDMYEEYMYQAEKFSVSKARYFYRRELLKVIRPNLLRNITGNQKLNKIGMLMNYSKIAFRNIKKHRTYSIVKIGGFSIGIAVCLLISLFVIEELKMGSSFEDKPVYRVLYSNAEPGFIGKSTSLQPVFAPTIKADYPEVVESGRVLNFDGFGDAGGNLFRPEDDEVSVYEERFGYADPAILNMLSFEMIYGDQLALDEPNSIILSKTKAEKYFGEDNPVGELVFINEDLKNPYRVSGVFEDLEDFYFNDISFFFTLSGKEFWKGEQTNWCCNNYTTFIQLAAKDQEESFRKKLKSIHDRYITAYYLEKEPTYGELIEQYNTIEIQPVSDIYLYSKGVYDNESVGDIGLVRIFIIVTVFILLLACMNFINLETANSAQRSKEIGLRKAVGSGKMGIVSQFLIEAIIVVSLSVVIGTTLAGLALPFFNLVVDKSISIPLDSPFFYLILLLFVVVIGLISGLYPAFYLSKTKTIEALSGKLKLNVGKSNGHLRNGLVVFQFTISMMLMAGALVVYKQMNFIFNKDLGYEKDQLMMVHGVGPMQERLSVLKEELVRLPEVSTATVSSSLPVEGTHRNGNAFWNAGQKKIEESISGQFWRADDDYVQTLGLEFVHGGSFDLQKTTDSTAVIINESMVDALGLGANPIGKEIENWARWRVVGVVKDFHFSNLKNEVRPLLIAPAYWGGDIITLKLESDDMLGSLTSIEKIWNSFNPDQQIRTEFLDQRFAMMYEDVKRTRTIFLFFAFFAVVVACLGLFGLSVYTVSIRSKEMTIRKVLGASAQTIIRLLSVDYLKLIIIGLVIAVPITSIFAKNWLNDFEYHIPSFWQVFVYGAALLLFIAMSVVSFQSLKSARSNPSDGLRSE